MPICIIGSSLDTDRFKFGIPLIGDIDGAKVIFYVPDVFVEASMRVHYNGQKLHVGDTEDYVVSESVVGSGYDTIIFNFAPRINDRITANYIVAI